MNHLTQLDTADSPMTPPQRCQCGHLARQLAFDHADVDRACFDMYAWLIADPQAPDPPSVATGGHQVDHRHISGKRRRMVKTTAPSEEASQRSLYYGV